MNQDNQNKILEELKKIARELEDLRANLRFHEERLRSLEKVEVPPLPKEIREEAPSPPPPPPPPPPVPFAAPPKEINWEAVMGGNWLVKVGVAAIIVGVGFFLKYAFDNNWIGPTGRVISGIITGIILIGLGEYWKERYAKYAQALAGGGTAVLYLSIFAAFNFYNLISVYPAFFLMAVITISAGALAVRYNAPAIAFLGIAGGFFTPFMLGVKNLAENQNIILAYTVLLNLGILAISAHKNWRALSFIGFLFTYASFGYWFANLYKPERLFYTEFVLTIFFLLFAFITIVYHLLSRQRAEWPDLALMTANAAIYFIWSFSLLQKDYRELMGFFVLILALFYFLLACFAYFRNREDPYLTLFLAGISLVFLTIAVPIQLKQHWITIAWAAEGVVLSWLGFYLRSYHLRSFSLLVFLLVVFRLFVFDMGWEARNLEGFIPIFNKRFFVFLVSIIAFYISSYIWWLGRSEIRKEEKPILPALLLSANFLTLWIFSHEIIRYFDTKIAKVTKPLPKTIFGQEKFDYEGVKNLRFLQNLTVSLFWAAYAWLLSLVGLLRKYSPIRQAGLFLVWVVIGKVLLFDILAMGRLSLVQGFSLSFIWGLVAIITVIIGIIWKYSGLRIAGLAFLWVMVFKVFLVDTWNLSQLYRVGAYMSLGVILLVTGYLYMRFHERIKEFLLES